MERWEAQTIEELRTRLLDWFAQVARPLPWRRGRTLYGTWIAEIMLQQTTVAVVEPYWLRFLERFPTVADLAAAQEQEVMAHWSGLGYYRRARHLHQAAKVIMAADGSLPKTREQWAALPGVGAYASGAIASQALGIRVPAVDANARRVLIRWAEGDPALAEHWKPRQVEQWAQSLVPAACPGDWNEAVMELGALVCRPRNPSCDVCPVLDHCRAGLAGTADQVPQPAGRARSQAVDAALLVLGGQEGVWLVPADAGVDLVFSDEKEKAIREDFSGLNQGLLGLPGTAWYPRREKCRRLGWHADSPLAALWVARFGPDHLPDLDQAREVGFFDHAITRYRLRVRVFRMDLDLIPEPDASLNDIDSKPAAGYFCDKEIISDGPRAKGTRSRTRSPMAFPLTGMTRKALQREPDNFG